MPPGREPPKMLQNVVKAISDLKDAQGSTLHRIVSRCLSSNQRPIRRRDFITNQVRKALKQGAQAGVIIQHAKKFKLATTPSKCNNIVARSCANRRRRPPPARRQKRRSRRESTEVSTTSVSEASELPSEISSGDELVEAVRRTRSRKRRRNRSRRRGRKSKRRQSDQSLDDKSEDNSAKNNNNNNNKKRPRRKKSGSDKDDNNYGDQQKQQQECDNPDCLCNLKQENNERQGSDGEDGPGELAKY